MGENAKVQGTKWLDIGIGWYVMYEHTDWVLDFKAYQVAGIHRARGEETEAEAFFERENGEFYSIQKNECVVSGHVKWSECSEITVEQHHFCSHQDIVEFGQVLEELHKLRSLLPKAKLSDELKPSIPVVLPNLKGTFST